MGKILINADPYLIFYEYFQIRNAFFQDKVLDELKVDDRCTIDLGDFKTFVKIIKAYSIYNEIYFNSDINKVITMFFSLPTQMIIFDGQNFMDNYQDYLEYYKEMPINFYIPSSYYDNSLKSGNILSSGVIDLLFITNDTYNIVDYKTDKVSSMDELKDLYKIQLDLYEIALREKMNAKNVKKFIYSIYLGKFIEV